MYLPLITYDIKAVKKKCSNYNDLGVKLLLQRKIGLFQFIQSVI